MHGGIYDESYGPKHQQLMWEAWQAAYGSAPTPPAGGEVEVLAVAWIKVTRPNNRGNAYELDWYSAAERLPVGEYELVDETHVTRLQAECEGHIQECQRRRDACADLIEERDRLQADKRTNLEYIGKLEQALNAAPEGLPDFKAILKRHGVDADSIGGSRIPRHVPG